MSDKQEAANSKAFETGQQAWREGKHHNPYPEVSPYHDLWRQGWEKERDTVEK
jgi:hypothetical protein